MKLGKIIEYQCKPYQIIYSGLFNYYIAPINSNIKEVPLIKVSKLEAKRCVVDKSKKFS